MNKEELKKTIKNITDIKTSQELLDLAFSRARKKKEIDAKINIVHDILIDRLKRIIKTFPRIDTLPSFYKELLNNRIGIVNIKKALGKINGAILVIERITKTSKKKELRHFYGRISSLIKDLDRDLETIRNAKKQLRELPIIDPTLFTVALTGLPNVGKTTMLNILANTSAEVAPYAFTTKHINIGRFRHGLLEIQLLDTPGVLGRPKKNSIEEEAWIAMNHAAHIIIFVVDPLQGLEEQLRLLKQLKQDRLFIYISKTDMINKEKLGEIIKRLEAFNIPILTSREELGQLLIEKAKRYYKEFLRKQALSP